MTVRDHISETLDSATAKLTAMMEANQKATEEQKEKCRRAIREVVTILMDRYDRKPSLVFAPADVPVEKQDVKRQISDLARNGYTYSDFPAKEWGNDLMDMFGMICRVM